VKVVRDELAGDNSFSAIFGLIAMVFLYFAIRNWILVIRPKLVLRLSPQRLTVERAYREATVPWSGVTRLRIVGDVRRPWLIAGSGRRTNPLSRYRISGTTVGCGFIRSRTGTSRRRGRLSVGE
jgi:hypothetical protein